MPRIAANIGFLFPEHLFLNRFAAAAKAGFKGVEYPSPYEHDKHVLAEELQRNGLTQVLHNLPRGKAKGERGIACHPDRVAEFQDGVELAIEYATALGCKQVNCLSGIAPEGVAQGRLHSTFIANLKFAACRTGEHGIRLLIEPINTHDVPGFHLNTSAQALAIIEEVGSDNLFLQYDIYHMQIMEGNLAPTIERNLARIAHIQFADTPGRHEPGTGEINFPFLFGFLDRIGYAGWASAEYQPLAGTEAGLGWSKAYFGR